MKPQRLSYHFLHLIINFFCGLFFITHPSSIFAYTPPIGIPDPGLWGSTHPIDSVAPATTAKCPNWPNSTASNCYYIDNTHPQATDSGNATGYPSKPRLTLPSNTFSAGAYIEMHGGPYTTNMNLYMTGTAANPIWFRGTSASQPVFSNYINFREGKYLFVEYLDFNGGNGGCLNVIGEASNNVVVRNSKFRNRVWTGNTAGLGITPHQNGNIHDIVIYNNEFSELGDWEEEADQDFHGINPDTYGRTPPTELSKVWILKNSFYHLSGNGVQVNANSVAMTDRLHHVYMGKNTGHACRQAILWSKQGSHVIMSQNVAYDNRVHGSQPGNGIGYQYAPDNLWIIFNEIYDSSNGIRQSDTTSDLTHSAYFIGNKIYDIHPGVGESYNPSDFFRPGQAFALWQGGMNRYIVDNTVYDIHGGVMINYDGPVDISGNVISGIYDSDFHISNNNARAVTTLNYNLLYDSNSNARFKWSSTYTSLATFLAGTGKCATNCSESNPAFIDAANYDLRPQNNSPLIGKGIRHNVYTVFKNLYGIDIDYDFNGNRRPTSGPWTLGAFESPLTAPQFKVIEFKQ